MDERQIERLKNKNASFKKAQNLMKPAFGK